MKTLYLLICGLLGAAISLGFYELGLLVMHKIPDAIPYLVIGGVGFAAGAAIRFNASGDWYE